MQRQVSTKSESPKAAPGHKLISSINGAHHKHTWRRSSSQADILKDYIDNFGDSHPAAEALLHLHHRQESGEESTGRPVLTWESYHWIRFKMHSLMEEPRSSRSACIMSALMIACVLLSLISFVIESLPSYSPEVHPETAETWLHIEMFFNSCFTVEYLIRFWSTSSDYASFLLASMNVIDLLSVLPFWIQMMPFGQGGGNASFLRVFRLLRVLRIFKLARFSVHLRIIVEAFVWAIDPLILLAVFVSMGIFLFSALLWFLERGDWDSDMECFVRLDDLQKCSPYQSIPLSMYWAVTTMTTVGYGDAVPVSPAGKMVTCIAMISGILVIAMPVSILSKSFQQCFDSVQDEFKLETVEDMQCQYAQSEDAADVETLQSICQEVRSSRDKLTELMPEIRALLRKHSMVVHRSSCGADLTTGLCDVIENNLVGELSLLWQVLEGYAVDILQRQSPSKL